MGFTTSYSGTIEYARNRWPAYLLGSGGTMLLLLIALVTSWQQGWYGFVNLAFAALLIVLYLTIASLWLAHRLYDGTGIVERIIKMESFDPRQKIVCVDLGLRRNSGLLARRLTTGKVISIDIYNPQLAPARWLSRAVSRAKQRIEDPRIEWSSGSIDLLPLPDSSIQTVITIMTLSEYWQQGDREQLLEEIYRLMTSGGTLYLVERVRTISHWLVQGPAAARLPQASYWISMLERAGFTEISKDGYQDLVEIFRAKRAIQRDIHQPTLGIF